MNYSVVFVVDELAKLKKYYGPRLLLLENNYWRLCMDMDMIINTSKDKLEALAKGLVFLNEKEKEWTGRSLFSE